MKHELIVKVEPLGPPKRKTEKPADLDDVWYPVPGKPDFEVNGRGQLRTKVDLPPAAPAPAYSFVILPADDLWASIRDLVPYVAPGEYWGRSIPAMLDEVKKGSVDALNRIFKEFSLDDPVIKVV